MNFHKTTSTWKLLMILAALFIVTASLWYTNTLAKDIAAQEKKKVTLWASAYQSINQANLNSDIHFLFEVIKANKSVPVILTDNQGKVKAWRNLDSSKVKNNPAYLTNELTKMKTDKEPLGIEISEGQMDFIYYKDSFLLTQLRYYPYIQLGIISLFLLIAYIAFRDAKTAEQNLLWVGMAKETAHQLGTPISSLVAWVELLKSRLANENKSGELIGDIEKDLGRLQLVAERFSKIGSKPKLERKNLHEYLSHSVDYIRKRSSNQVQLTLDAATDIEANINPPLFEWVIENLLKNALDAINGKGKISVVAIEQKDHIQIDIKDSGKGIPKSQFKDVFKPGFSTKKRGWGLGLALTKRIIEKFHFGNIIVQESTVGKGTTFRIKLPVG